MTPPEERLVIGAFERPEKAREAYEELRRAGFVEENLGVAAPVPPEQRGESDSPAIAAPTAESVGVGGGVGAVLGAMAGGGVALVVPGIGPILAAGIFALAGASLGGLAGSLLGLSVPESEARYYEHQLHVGNVLLAVRPNGRRAEAETIMQRLGGKVRAEKESHRSSPDADRSS